MTDQPHIAAVKGGDLRELIDKMQPRPKPKPDPGLSGRQINKKGQRQSEARTCQANKSAKDELVISLFHDRANHRMGNR
jgi:hypothetical protein